MQKLVVTLDIHDDADCKRKALSLVSSIPGIESIAMNTEKRELTVVGGMDPVAVVKKLRKNYKTKIVSVGPAKEPEKPKVEAKKVEEPKKVEAPKNVEAPKPAMIKVNEFVPIIEAYNPYYNYYNHHPFYYRYNGY